MVVPGWPLVYDLCTEDYTSPATFWEDLRLPAIFAGNRRGFSAEYAIVKAAEPVFTDVASYVRNLQKTALRNLLGR